MITLSSSRTFLAKLVMPPLWILGTGVGVAVMIFGNFVRTPSEGLPFDIKILLLLGWGASSIFMIYMAYDLKKVRLDGNILYVSNFQEEIAVPAQNIDRIFENYFMSDRPVTIYFKNETKFGKKIRFIPKLDLKSWILLRPHPTVLELKKRSHI